MVSESGNILTKLTDPVHGLQSAWFGAWFGGKALIRILRLTVVTTGVTENKITKDIGVWMDEENSQ